MHSCLPGTLGPDFEDTGESALGVWGGQGAILQMSAQQLHC